MIDQPLWALRNSAALSWSDHVTCARVRGLDAFDVMDHLCTSELHLRDGQILSTLFLNEEAVPVADLYLARDDEEFILLGEGMSAAELCHHVRAKAPEGADFEIIDLNSSHRVLSLNGPYSWEVLAGVAGPEVIGLPYLTFFPLGDTLCFRTGKTGEYGYDLMIPREDSEEMREQFLEVGSAFDLALAGLEALEVCALENWFFNIRKEGQFNLTPLELQLQWRVSFQKDFVGSLALDARRQAGIESRLTCIESPTPISVGDRVSYRGTDLGTILNAAASPVLGHYLGLALLTLSHASSGLDGFEVESNGGRVQVRTISPPAIHNRSLFLNPQLHSYLTRGEFDFPPIAPPGNV